MLLHFIVGAAEDSVCNSLDFEFTRSCSEADYSPIVPDKAGFKLQNSQSCDSGLQLGDEGQECRGRLSDSKMPRSAKIQYYTSSESREEDDGKQLMPKKVRHCKKRPAPGIPILQPSSSVDTLSSIQSAESLHLHSIESPHNESVDQSLVSFSDVLPGELFLDAPAAPSKRTLFFQSMLQPPPANPFNVSPDQSADTLSTPETVKSQKKLSTNDSGVSFLGSLNNNSEEISDAEHGRDAGSVCQKNRPPTVEVSLEHENGSTVSIMPSTFIQQNLSGGRSHQFDQTRSRPPPLSDLHGTTFAEEFLETPEELKEDEFEYAKKDSSASSVGSAFINERFSLDSCDDVLGESCLGSGLNQKSPCLLSSSDSSWPDAPTDAAVEEKESRQQDSSPRRPLIRADAVESDPEKLQQGMTTAFSGMSSQSYLHQPGVSPYRQPVLYDSTSVSPVGEKLSAMSSESPTPIAVDSSYRQVALQNSRIDDANLCNPVYKEITLEKANVLLHHHKPSEQHSTSSVRKYSEESSARKQLIPHWKSLDNVSLRTDSKNLVHLEQIKSPSHDSLVTNKLLAQEMREAVLTESELSKCKDISNSHHHIASLKDISQHKAKRQPIVDRMEKTPTHALKSKQFSEIRSFYDRCHEKGSGSLQSAEVVSDAPSSSHHNIRLRVTKKRSRNRYLKKPNSDPRLNVEGKGGSDLGRSKSDSSERHRNSKRVPQANSRRCEMEWSKENFASLENILLQKNKNIERSGKSMSAKDLSASVRSTIHHNENVKRKSVTIKDREWHKELAKQYIQSARSYVDLSPSRKPDLSCTAYRFGREVDKSLSIGANADHGCTGRRDLDISSHLSKASSAGEIFLNDKLTGEVYDDGFKDTSQHTSKPSQKVSLISSSLTPSVVKPRYSVTKEVPHMRSLKLSNTSVRQLRENFLGLPSNSDASKVPNSCSRTYISSLSTPDSAMISKNSRRPLYESVGRIMGDAKLLDPANISWSVARLKELYSSQDSESTNLKTRMSHSKSEDWSPSTKVSALPRLG